MGAGRAKPPSTVGARLSPPPHLPRKRERRRLATGNTDVTSDERERARGVGLEAQTDAAADLVLIAGEVLRADHLAGRGHVATSACRAHRLRRRSRRQRRQVEAVVGADTKVAEVAGDRDDRVVQVDTAEHPPADDVVLGRKHHLLGQRLSRREAAIVGRPAIQVDRRRRINDLAARDREQRPGAHVRLEGERAADAKRLGQDAFRGDDGKVDLRRPGDARHRCPQCHRRERDVVVALVNGELEVAIQGVDVRL